MIGPSVGVGVGHRFGGGFDPSASAFFAATGITGTTEQQAVNTLVTSLKSAGLWSKMKAVYPFVTDNRNLLSYTEDFSNAYWQKFSTSLTTDNTTAPNGTTTADKLTIGITNDEHIVFNTVVASTTAGQYTSSVYLKKGNTDYIQVANNGANSANYAYIVININNGAVTQSGAGGTYTLNSYDVTSVGNGWYRCSITHTTTGDEARGLRVRFSNSATPTIGAYGGIYFLGNGTDFFYLWGGQFQPGALTTYQPIATTQQSYISNQFKYNLVNPVDSDAAFRGVFNGGWTFSNQGATPNGTNGYMDTKILGGTDLLTNNSGIGIYSGSNTTSTGGFGTGPNFHIYPRYTDNNTYYRPLNASGGTSVNNGTALGMFHQYSDGTNGNGFFNGTKKGTTTVNQTMDAANLFFGGQRPSSGNYDSKQLRFAFASLFLTDTEATALYNAVQTFNTSLSRQV